MEMNENLPEFIESIPVKTEPVVEKTDILPPYSIELFKEKIVGLSDDVSQINNINIWWRTIDRSAAWVKRANLALTVDGLPKQEKVDAEFRFDNIDSTFKDINSSLNDLLTFEPNKIKKILNFMSISLNKGAKKVERLSDEILRFDEIIHNPLKNQIIAFSEAFNETRDLNNTKKMRMKIAQWAFEETIVLFPRIQMRYQNAGVPEPTTVDMIDEEKSELVDALKGELWRPEEVEKWKKIYEQNRNNMDNFSFNESVIEKFEFLFGSALGKIPEEEIISAIRSLIVAEDVIKGVKNNNTLKNAWDHEA